MALNYCCICIYKFGQLRKSYIYIYISYIFNSLILVYHKKIFDIFYKWGKKMGIKLSNYLTEK